MGDMKSFLAYDIIHVFRIKGGNNDLLYGIGIAKDLRLAVVSKSCVTPLVKTIDKQLINIFQANCNIFSY